MTRLDKHIEFLKVDMYAAWGYDKRMILEVENRELSYRDPLQRAHQAARSAMQRGCHCFRELAVNSCSSWVLSNIKPEEH